MRMKAKPSISEITLGFWPHPVFKAGVNTELGAHCLRQSQ